MNNNKYASLLNQYYNTNYRHMAIPSDALLSGQKYQRLVKSKHVRDIIENFDPLKVDEPLVSVRDGKFYLVNGQHTVASLVGLNSGKPVNVNCRVIDNLTYEQEANFYARQDEGHLAQTQYSKLNADREAKKKDAIDFFDTGSAIKGKHIDVCVESHDEAIQAGVKTATVWWCES